MLTIQNEYLRLTVDPHGAQMMELATGKGTQLLWNGDEKYWTDRAPVLFPFVGRLTGGQYRIHGKVYPMSIHGFAAASEFSVLEQSADTVTLALRDNEETLRQYPLHFEFLVRYALHGRELEIGYTVRNPNAEELPFGIGGHPGFRVPLCAGTAFEDYYLRFSEPREPDRVGFTPSVFLSGHDERYPLENAQLLRLRHELFDDDAIILKNMARSVTLCSDKTPLAITVTYPQMDYLGLWHMPKTDAPYLCIEPWRSLPSRQDVVEEFDCKSDLVHLAPGGEYQNCWKVAVTGE